MKYIIHEVKEGFTLIEFWDKIEVKGRVIRLLYQLKVRDNNVIEITRLIPNKQ